LPALHSLVHALRRLTDLPLTDVAHGVGLAISSVSRVESGLINDPATVAAVLKFYGAAIARADTAQLRKLQAAYISTLIAGPSIMNTARALRRELAATGRRS